MVLYMSGLLLLLLMGTSLWFAFSGNVEDHSQLGWLLLGAFAAAFLFFFISLFRIVVDPRVLYISVIGSVLILMTQGPLLFELLSRSFFSNSAGNLTLMKSYSIPERMVSEDDISGAIAEYEKLIREDPADIVARFRIADLYCRTTKYEKAVQAYETLVSLKGKLDVNQHCSALMRLSEISAQQLADIASARQYLERIIREYPESRMAGYAAERLKTL